MKKAFLCVMVLILMFSLCSCSNGVNNQSINVPDVIGTDIETAKNVVSSVGLVPKVEYENNDSIDRGLVIDVKSNSVLHPGDSITLIVSNGASKYVSKNSTFSASHNTLVDLHFYDPYIEDNTLYIILHDVEFVNAVAWKEATKNNNGFGEATINDDYDKSVPLQIINSPTDWKKGETIDFTLEIPLGDLNVSEPTDLTVKLIALDESGNQENIIVSFTMAW